MGLIVGERETERAKIVIHRIRPGLLHSIVGGHLDRSIIEVMIRCADAEIRTRPKGIEHFLDCREVRGYQSDARVCATDWAMAQRAPYPILHIVTSKPLVNMGVAAAGLALTLAGRPLHAYLSAEKFASELAARRSPSAGTPKDASRT